MPHDPSADADITGLRKVDDAFGHRVTYFATSAAVDDVGPTYQCWGGVPHSLFPLVTCKAAGPSGASLAVTFDTSAYGAPGDIPPLDLYPQPDFALVAITFGVEFTPYTIGCTSGGSPDPTVPVDAEPGFDCARPFLGVGEAGVSPAFASGSFDWHPWSGWDAQAYDPGRDPAYDDTTGSVWTQIGLAMIAPPAPAYVDPDVLDPNADHAPFLWNWADVLNQTVTVDVSGDTWHRIRTDVTGGGGLGMTVYPYRLATPATTSDWMHVL